MPDDDNLPTTATVPTQLVSSVSSASTQDNTQLALLTQRVSQLSTEVTSLKRQMQDHQRPRSSTPQQRQYRPRSPTPQRRQQRFRSRSSGLCWYHNYFGSKASKCDPPCSYAASNEKGEY
ncbi:hypothetical protein GWK47_021868 [Chionoecetes opilio]|uniref:Uncharacterized protein n=1 Tax=Chionoecetes opilio TaxID=41210 RepID=A0A8J5CGH8_CHIOP|nr:hypothetical protein GWK47_021868 [Chionoecetes opilio]